jgi:hypothetical protein
MTDETKPFDYGAEFRERMAKRKKGDKLFEIILTYVYPFMPTVEFFSDRFKNIGAAIGFLFPMLPLLFGFLLLIVNNGGGGRATILTWIAMTLLLFFTAGNYEFVNLLFWLSLISVYVIGYYQILTKKNHGK